MAGRNHHYVPQLLQKGFSARKTKKGVHQVWFYQNGREPFLTGTRNILAEKDFYGPPPTPLVDQLITDAEVHRFDELVNDLRSSIGTRFIGLSDVVSEFVHQVSIRVRWIRSLFETGGKKILSRANDALSNKTSAGRLLGRQIKAEPGWLEEILTSEAEKKLGRGLSREERGTLSSMVSVIAADPGRMLEHIDLSPMLRMVNELHALLTAHTQAGHIKGLERSLGQSESEFRSFMQRLHWSVVSSKTSGFILGDCGPLHIGPQGSLLGPMGVAKHDEVTGVILPISTSQVIVGAKSRSPAIPAVSDLNHASAAWSSDAFIANADTPQYRELQLLITSEIDSFLESQIAPAFSEE